MLSEIAESLACNHARDSALAEGSMMLRPLVCRSGAGHVWSSGMLRHGSSFPFQDQDDRYDK